MTSREYTGTYLDGNGQFRLHPSEGSATEGSDKRAGFATYAPLIRSTILSREYPGQLSLRGRSIELLYLNHILSLKIMCKRY